jgi:hypothetical protein
MQDGSSLQQVTLNCNHEEIGCKISTSVVSWILIFLRLAAMGLSWICLASLGNSNQPTKTVFSKVFTTVQLLVSIAVVILATTIPFFYEFKTMFFDTYKEGHNLYAPAYWTSLIGGFVIILLQVTRLIGIYLPIGMLESGDMGIKEKRTKKAASNKVQTIIEHALHLYNVPPEFKSMRVSSVSETVKSLTSSFHASKRSSSSTRNENNQSKAAEALLNFHRVHDAVEVQGGVLWSLKQFWNGTLHQKEGIYLHGRLLAVNCVQYFVVAFMVSMYFLFWDYLREMLTKYDDGCDYTVGKDGEMLINDPDWNTYVYQRASSTLLCA